MRKVAGVTAVVSLVVGLLFAMTGSSTGAVGPNVITVQGVADVGGHKTFVEIVLAVPPGRSAAAVADEALAAQGARRPQPADYTTEGFTWPQLSGGSGAVTQYYNPANEPTGAGQALTNSENTWSSVPSSYFAFANGGTTSRCPSLVRECPGPQTYDGNNDVAWLALGGCCTLGVTWYGTGPSGPEADMALNTKFTWSTSGGDYDVETVFLHENGHVAGLGHSSDPSAVMYPSYHGVLRELQCDDINGITSLYPNGNANTCAASSTATPTSAATSTPTPTPTAASGTPTATSTPAPTKCPPGNPNAGRCR
jgi:hypothetical protein